MTDHAGDVLDQLLRQRHSCRAFLPDPVPRETQERFFVIAQRTASWCNSQAWQVTVASGAAVERLREALVAGARAGERASDFPFPEAYTGRYLARRRQCGLQLYEAVGVARGDKEGAARQALENFRLFGAPHVAILSSDPGLGVYGAVDVGGYVQVLLLAMQALGVAAIPQAALSTQSARLKSMLGIPPERKVVCAISFGWEDREHAANGYRTTRAPLAEAVEWVDA